MTINSSTRRTFLAAATGATTGCMISPKNVLGGRGKVGANEKLNIACIGFRGKGHSDARAVSDENIVALCDVDLDGAARTVKEHPGAALYTDYREMLEKQTDIDAVMIATPDHTHAMIAMAAIRAGKHVFCQKPLTRTAFEARELTKAARKAGVATQMGNQGHASEQSRLTCETIWDGAIGPVREVHAWTNRPIWPQGIGRPADTPDVPANMKWDLWLGPAPERAYHPAYHPFKWRGWWDFGTGALGDIGCHTLHTAFRALKLGHPESIEASSSPVNKETYPLASTVTYHFPARGEMPPVKVFWYDGGLLPPRPEGLEPGRRMGANGIYYVGDKGVLWGHYLIPDSLRDEYGKAPRTLERSIGHYKEWIAACKGGPAGGSNFDIAGHLSEVVLLGNIPLHPSVRGVADRERLLWDGENFKFNLDEANKLLHYTYRKGWTL